MSDKILRVHTIEAVYVGPKEPHSTLPPHDEVAVYGRNAEWVFREEKNGDVIVTHTNPRAVHMGKSEFAKPHAPHGMRYVTRIPAANIRDVQYEFDALPAPTSLPLAKGAA